MRKLVVLNVAALSPFEVDANTPGFMRLAQRGAMSPLIAPEPALTCPSHATMLTGALPSEHGIVANGWYDRERAQVFNWGRSDNLINGRRLWDDLRDLVPCAKVANLFWRFCSHSSCDLTLTERPTYFSNGRKGADVYASDAAFKALCEARLGSFPFFHFWGPKANLDSSRWILGAARLAVEYSSPDLLLCYAPGLDYDVQRFGPSAPETKATLGRGDALYSDFIEEMLALDYDVMVVSDYGFSDVSAPVYPNRALREAGLVHVDDAVNGEWLEPGASRAFAVCDNQIAHVYVKSSDDIDAVRNCLSELDGVKAVLGTGEGSSTALGHARSGDLLLHAESHRWFAYPYWLNDSKAPDFSKCVDIFNKPGFDPCELFLRAGVGGALHAAKRFAQMKTGIRAPFDVISTDGTRVRGSRSISPVDDAHNAVLITSWKRPGVSVAMTDLKSLILNRMTQ